MRYFYVSVIDGARHGFLAGPFQTHDEALAKVDAARAAANEVDPRAWFYAYGTAKAPDGYDRPGVLNDKLFKPTFCEWLAAKLGTTKWVVSQRLTPRLKAKGYAVAVSEVRFKRLEAEYRGET